MNSDIQSIHSGDIYNITRNYKFDSKGQTIILQDRIIEINQDNIVINGNGFKIDAGESQNFAIFKVLGNNVTINNLTFANSESGAIPGPTIYDDYRYVKINSPVCWNGDAGVMKDCTFYNDCAVNGGAVSWTGNNGTIDNCKFINDTSRGAGGALYVCGANNTVSNCVFINSNSQLTGEAIYMDRNRKNIKILNNTFTNEIPVIDGSVFNIDVDYLFYSYKIYAFGNISTSESYKLDVVPLIYSSIIKGGVNIINDNLKYYAQYFNETGDFALNIEGYEEISDPSHHLGLDYLKSMRFYNITDFNQVFNLAIHGNYEFAITQNLIGFVSNLEDYFFLTCAEAIGYWFNTDQC